MPPHLATMTQSFGAGCFPFAGERGDVTTFQEPKGPFSPKIKRFSHLLGKQLIRSGLARGSGFPLDDFDSSPGCPPHRLTGVFLEGAEDGHVRSQKLAALRGLGQHGEGLGGVQACLAQG